MEYLDEILERIERENEILKQWEQENITNNKNK